MNSNPSSRMLYLLVAALSLWLILCSFGFSWLGGETVVVAYAFAGVCGHCRGD